MKQTEKFKLIRQKVIYTVSAGVLICAAIFSMMLYIFVHSEEEAFHTLHMETQQIKNTIELQFFSDRENLITMANFASKLYSDGESFDLLFNSFEKIGLIENIGILLPDNSFITKKGTIDVSDVISFEEEAQRGEYISGRIKDITNPEREVIRSSVPIEANGEIVAVLYGTIELDTLKTRYTSEITTLKSYILVVEGKSGNYIIDTKNEYLGNITSLAATTFKTGFSYDRIINDITNNSHGYSAFLSTDGETYLYVHYAPLTIGDWNILLAKPEKVVFSGAREIGNYLMFMLLIVIIIMILYLLLLFNSEAKKLKTSSCTSDIRKRLLQLNRNDHSLYTSLSDIASFAKSSSSFFADTYGLHYTYIEPSSNATPLTDDEMRYFIETLFNYGSKNKIDKSADNYHIEIVIDKHLKNTFSEFYKFATAHNIKRIDYAIVIGNNSTALVGVINAKTKYIYTLLKDISVCFSMAIYNKKHLDNTEKMALTDSLTGISNRLAYKYDKKKLEDSLSDKIACIYIDVNELHYFNNKYGHAAGDHMLEFIAQELKNQFPDSPIYRMGGDEFLLFAKLEPHDLESRMSAAVKEIEEMKYHISYGIAYSDENTTIDDLLTRAEVIMYEEKSKYYQHKQQASVFEIGDKSIEHITTGMHDLDAALSVMSLRYHGVFCVSLENDTARKIFNPKYFDNFSTDTTPFTDILNHYIHNMVMPDYQRSMLSFLNYDILKKQLLSGSIPGITYRNTNGESISLRVYMLSGQDSQQTDTIWTFEKEHTTQ